MFISKLDYVAFHECPRKYYLLNNHPDLKQPSLTSKMLMDQGDQINELAKTKFPGGKSGSVWTGENKLDVLESVAKTKALLEEGCENIYDAVFLYDAKFLVKVDIFQKDEGYWYIREVKSVSGSEIYLFLKDGSKNAAALSCVRDIAFQKYFLLRDFGIALKSELICVNQNYIRQDELDLAKFLDKYSMDTAMEPFLSEIPNTIKAMNEIKELPETVLGSKCRNPHPCFFKDYCWANVDEKSIFKIPRLSEKKATILLDKGFKEVSQITDFTDLTPDQSVSVKRSLSVKIAKNPMLLNIFLGRVKGPIHFLDFETISNIIPKFKNTKSMEPVPFEYSLHVLGADKVLTNHVFLHDKNEDPRRYFIEDLIAHCGKSGSVLVYNKTFEEGVLTRCAEWFPEYASQIKAIKDRILDLMAPFKEGWYYHPKMGFSYSLKEVGPALAPEIDYKSMEVGDGEEVMEAYEKLISLPEGAEKEALKQQMKDYCSLDTFSLVKILEVLKKP